LNRPPKQLKQRAVRPLAVEGDAPTSTKCQQNRALAARSTREFLLIAESIVLELIGSRLTIEGSSRVQFWLVRVNRVDRVCVVCNFGGEL
jgi:hypothetical protein